jgi:formiminotetrahydrofolate cyclodeaminase
MSESAMPALTPLIAALAGEPPEGGSYPVAGAVAALVAAMAASLAAAAADRSRAGWEEAAGARAQAQALRRRALALAERSADAYRAAREALADPGPWLGSALEGAAQPQLELLASAADIAQLASAVARDGAGEVRADAVVAAELAAAATAAAARLVRVNLVLGHDPETAERAREHLAAATAAARLAAEALG